LPKILKKATKTNPLTVSKGATVTFTAYITQDGRDATFTENSNYES